MNVPTVAASMQGIVEPSVIQPTPPPGRLVYIAQKYWPALVCLPTLGLVAVGAALNAWEFTLASGAAGLAVEIFLSIFLLKPELVLTPEQVLHYEKLKLANIQSLNVAALTVDQLRAAAVELQKRAEAEGGSVQKTEEQVRSDLNALQDLALAEQKEETDAQVGIDQLKGDNTLLGTVTQEAKNEFRDLEANDDDLEALVFHGKQFLDKRKKDATANT